MKKDPLDHKMCLIIWVTDKWDNKLKGKRSKNDKGSETKRTKGTNARYKFRVKEIDGNTFSRGIYKYLSYDENPY